MLKSLLFLGRLCPWTFPANKYWVNTHSLLAYPRMLQSGYINCHSGHNVFIQRSIIYIFVLPAQAGCHYNNELFMVSSCSHCCLFVCHTVVCWSARAGSSTTTLPAMILSYLQVSVLKAKINEAVGLPGGKQKLQYDVSNSVIFYHMTLLVSSVN